MDLSKFTSSITFLRVFTVYSGSFKLLRRIGLSEGEHNYTATHNSCLGAPYLAASCNFIVFGVSKRQDGDVKEHMLLFHYLVYRNKTSFGISNIGA